MDIIALETDSVTPKTPDNTHLMFYEKQKHPKCMTSFGVHFGILPIKKVAYGCQCVNSARIILKSLLNKNHQ